MMKTQKKLVYIIIFILAIAAASLAALLSSPIKASAEVINGIDCGLSIGYTDSKGTYRTLSLSTNGGSSTIDALYFTVSNIKSQSNIEDTSNAIEMEGRNITATGTYNLILNYYIGSSPNRISFTWKHTLIVVCSSPTISGPSLSNSSFTVTTSAKSASVAGIYYRLGSGGYSYSSGSSYTVSGTSANNGTWDFYAVDSAGNISRTISCTLDTIAPTTSSLPAYTNSNINFSASDATSGVLRIYYRKGSSGSYSSAAGSSYTVSATTANNGTWYFYAEDRAGNTSSVDSCTIDTVAPTITSLPTYTNTTISVSASDAASGISGFYFRRGTTGSYSYASGTTYTVSATAANNGVWYFYAVDRAGNSSSIINCTLDTVAPEHPILPEYTNKDIVYKPADALTGVVKIYYRLGNTGTYSTTTAASFTVRALIENNGVWYFYAEDSVGNKSNPLQISMCILESFGNSDLIYNSFKVVSWYRVTLPGRVFNISGKDISGNYTFDSYDSALRFATAKETEYRCTVISGGWIYVSATNESVSQLYTEKDALDTAIRKYATSYISTVQKLSSSGTNNYYTTVNSDGDADAEALTRQLLMLPDFLEDFSHLDLFMLAQTYSFKKPAGIPFDTFVRFTYIANDIQQVNGTEINIPYGVAVKSVLTQANHYIQGYYLVTEYDDAGNSEEYLVYIDLQTPTLKANITRGDSAELAPITFDAETIEQYKKTFYYLSFEFNTAFDNIDTDFLCVFVSGRSLNNIYVSGDEFPTLSFENGFYGKYTVTVYDRSMNLLVFDIYIASAAPSWTHTSLSNEVSLRITANTGGDNNNAITKLELFKIMSDGSYLPIEQDDDGTVVDFTTLTYILRVGGRYTLRLTDLYGRTIELPSIFYLKDLPSGTLSGVKDGGRTNKEVTFKYAGTATLIVYVYINNQKQAFSDYTTTLNNTSNTYTVTFAAKAELSYEYVLFLYKSDDDSLYIEYKFEIDCVIGEVDIFRNNGDVIEYDGATNVSFYLTWSTEMSLRYYTSSTAGGSNSTTPYSKGTLLTKDALYYFIAKDDVGNTFEFTVLLKSKVNYKIDGSYLELSDRIVASKPITVTVIDNYNKFTVTSNNGYTFTNTSPIIYDGVYTLSVSDYYGNSLLMVIEIKTTLPEIKLEGVSYGGRTKSSVIVSYDTAEAKAWLTNDKGVAVKEVHSGAEFAEHGTYYIKAVDYAGNVTQVTFYIDLAVDYISSALNGQVTSSKVTFTIPEVLASLLVIHNGEITTGKDIYSDIGRYSICAEDTVGNVLEFRFEIIPARYSTFSFIPPTDYTVTEIRLNGVPTQFSIDIDNGLSLTENGFYEIILSHRILGTYLLSIEVDNIPPIAELTQTFGANGAVRVVSVSKSNLTYVLTKDGKTVEYTGKAIKDIGSYVLTIIDELGNYSVYEFEIKYALNTWAVIVVAVVIGAAALIIIFAVRSRTKIKVK